MMQNTLKSSVKLGATTDRPVRHLHQIELSRRWNISPRTLERWRWLKQGPGYIKIGGRVVYALADVEAFEQARRRQPAGTDGKAA